MGRVDIYPTTVLQGPPSSQLGYAEVTANQGTITTEVDLTGLAVTITVPTGRRIRVSGFCRANSNANSDRGVLRIKEGATVLQIADSGIDIQPAIYGCFVEVIFSPSAGTHTYKLSMERAGTGTITMNAGATFPAYIMVEDVTGTFWNGVPVTNPPTCRIFNSGSQAIADNTEASVVFSGEVFDTDTMHSTSVNTGRITFNTAGVYIVTLTFGFESATDYTSIYGAIRLNGTTVITYQTDEQTEQAQTPFINLTTIFKFAAADFVEGRVFQNNTANVSRNVLGSSTATDCVMAAAWVGLG